MNCEITTDNGALRGMSEDERKQLADGIDFVYSNILLNSANTVLGKNINYNRDIIKTLSINNVPYYIHPILSKRGIDTVFKVSIKVIGHTLLNNPIAVFKGEYNSLLNFSEEIEQLNDKIKNPPKPTTDEPEEDTPVETDPQAEEPKEVTKEEPTETTPESSNTNSLNNSENENTASAKSNSLSEEPEDEPKEETIEPASNSLTPEPSIDNSSDDDSENEKTESTSAQTPLVASYEPTLHNVGVEFPSDKKVEKKTKSHSLFSGRKKKSRKKNK